MEDELLVPPDPRDSFDREVEIVADALRHPAGFEVTTFVMLYARIIDSSPGDEALVLGPERPNENLFAVGGEASPIEPAWEMLCTTAELAATVFCVARHHQELGLDFESYLYATEGPAPFLSADGT